MTGARLGASGGSVLEALQPGAVESGPGENEAGAGAADHTDLGFTGSLGSAAADGVDGSGGGCGNAFGCSPFQSIVSASAGVADSVLGRNEAPDALISVAVRLGTAGM